MFGHDRYLIYSLLGRVVEVRLPHRQGGKRINGVVERVCRDIFSGEVEVTLNGSRHTFQEPAAIVAIGQDVHFLYGDIEGVVEDESALFETSFDSSIDDKLKASAPRPVCRTVFRVGDVKKTPRNRWRTRTAVV